MIFLKAAKELKREIVILILTLMLWVAWGKIKLQKAQLAARPETVEKVVTKVVQGPVKIVERIVTLPGGGQEINRTTEQAAVETSSQNEHMEKPSCVGMEAPRWLVGVSADPLRAQDPKMLKVGITLGGRLDLIVGRSVWGGNKTEIGTAVRF